MLQISLLITAPTGGGTSFPRVVSPQTLTLTFPLQPLFPLYTSSSISLRGHSPFGFTPNPSLPGSPGLWCMAICVFQKYISYWHWAASSATDGDKNTENGCPSSLVKMRGRPRERDGARVKREKGEDGCIKHLDSGREPKSEAVRKRGTGRGRWGIRIKQKINRKERRENTKGSETVRKKNERKGWAKGRGGKQRLKGTSPLSSLVIKQWHFVTALDLDARYWSASCLYETQRVNL